ncbi:hypothetical protein HYDPIDRAFT_31102 [Hydnomerulius pinastri MD-312]|uniref:Uncharacterized protein n=1 Tax=Hydnomerulius pinastri MD-312 TaxID=994086 RepID=A0A0C9V7Z1_9AGAM|nr:hypothetical protein HYDPIDRAFT_31102 [Hydnomerulius pinastri MD-312]
MRKAWEPRLLPLEGHKDTIQTGAVSPDGKHILTGSWDESDFEDVNASPAQDSFLDVGLIECAPGVVDHILRTSSPDIPRNFPNTPRVVTREQTSHSQTRVSSKLDNLWSRVRTGLLRRSTSASIELQEKNTSQALELSVTRVYAAKGKEWQEGRWARMICDESMRTIGHMTMKMKTEKPPMAGRTTHKLRAAVLIHGSTSFTSVSLFLAVEAVSLIGTLGSYFPSLIIETEFYHNMGRTC